MQYVKPSYRSTSPLWFAFCVIDGVTIIETITPGVYHVVGEDYSKSKDIVPFTEPPDAEWLLVKRVYANRNKIPKKGQYYTLRTHW